MSERLGKSQMMSLTMDNSPHAKLKAPTEDGGCLIWPEPYQWSSLAELNRLKLTTTTATVFDGSWYELSLRARAELLKEACRWTEQYRSIDFVRNLRAPARTRIYMTGHQPELFHPGVWLKNALVHAAAENDSAVGIHLIVDSDALKSVFVPVPGGSSHHPTVRHVPLDEGPWGWPHEERPVFNRAMFESFDRHVWREIREMVSRPLVPDFWSLVRESSQVNSRLGHVLAVARHRQEEIWGWRTLEVPQSRLAGLPRFLVFAAYIWLEAERFQTVHNRAIDVYRRTHRIRSRSHPFPHLIKIDDWYEVPFWTWETSQPYRRRVFTRRNGNCLEITDLENWRTCIPEASLLDAAWLAQWASDLEGNGRRIRGRAVTTTLWARCFLCDFFVHGLGGAKYDQVTDRIIRDFFQLEPPVYATATATVLLPVERPDVDEPDLRAIRLQLRNLDFHPDKHICLSTLPPDVRRQVESLIREKWEWINALVTPENAAKRFHRIREINQALQPHVEESRTRLLRLLRELEEKLQVRRILAARDWAFCLYPEAQLQAFYCLMLERFSR